MRKAVTFGRGLWAENVIFECENSIAVTVNARRYRNMITAFLWHEVNHFGLDDMWLQQYVTTCDISRDITNLLGEKFNSSCNHQKCL